MVIEIFAGTARVTAELRKIGMVSAFGIDHVRNRQAAAQVVQWLADEHVVGVFIAPPCGSASRARSIPLKSKSPGDPRPLRSDKHPKGLPNLLFVDRIKVSKVNKLYFLIPCLSNGP